MFPLHVPDLSPGFPDKFLWDSAGSQGVTLFCGTVQGSVLSFCFPEECSREPAVGSAPSAPLYPDAAADGKPGPGKGRN